MASSERRGPVVLSVAIVAVLALAEASGPVALGQAQEAVEVNLEVSFLDEYVVGDFVNLASGFIGDHNYSNPPADRIDPLHPRSWKWWRNVERPFSYTGERFQLGLGSKWTSQYSPGYGCGHPGDPCSFPGTFRDFCKAEAVSKLAQGMNPRWDFWGEPGWPGVGGEHPFLSATDYANWLRQCALGLREAYDEHPDYTREDLTLVAPSLWKWNDIYRVMFTQGSAGCTVLQGDEFFGSSFDCDAGEPTPFSLLAFLETYRDDLEVDLVSAHQFNDYMVQYWPWLFRALEEALDAETAARGLDPMEISVNEYIGPSYNLCVEPAGVHPDSPACLDPIHERENFLRPGHTVKGIAALHSGAVESAVKACWTDPTTGLSGCNEKALNGLLVGDASMAKRPVWHVYRLYGELSGHEISQEAVASTYRADGLAFEPLGAIATRNDALGEESYKILVGYSNLMYQPDLEIPDNDVFESFRGPYRTTNQVFVSTRLSGLDPDCDSATVFTTAVSGSDFISPMPSVARVNRGTYAISQGSLVLEVILEKNDALLIELESFNGDSRCLTDLDDDGQSDPVADPIQWIFDNSFEAGDTSSWSLPV